MWYFSPDKKWKLDLTQDGMELEQFISKDWWNPKGIYETLKEPYCKKCSNPGVSVLEVNGEKIISCMNCSNLKSVERIYAVGPYYPVGDVKHNESLLSKHINSLKQDKSLSIPLGSAMALAIKELYPQLATYDYIAPVPMDEITLNERKFNQSKELAQVVGDLAGISVADFLIKKEKLSLKDLAREARFNAASRVYALQSSHSELFNKRVLVIDDVSTTGATADSISRLLKENGAEAVSSLVAGRTYRPRKEDSNDVER